MNIWDIALIAVLAAAVGFAVRRVLRTRKNGGCGCGCGCEGCTKGCGMRRD